MGRDRSKRPRWLWPLVAAGAAVAWATYDIPRSMGGKPNRALLEGSPHYRDGRFHNTAPRRILQSGTMSKVLRELIFGKQRRHPSQPVPLASPSFATKPTGLRLTWYGHACTLAEIDGARVLFDPVWNERCSPSRLVGPRRIHPAPQTLEELPALDAIVISHDHYDHLDFQSIRRLAQTQTAPFLVPLGVGTFLRRWGIAEDRIHEFDWHDHLDTAGLRFTATPAQHFSGRGFTNDPTLWASWVVAGPQHRVFYTGDSGYFDGYAEIGERYGPFDVTLIQVGAYDANWPDIHMTPEEGVAAHLDVRGRLLIPVHWCTFVLGLHDWAEPAERVWREAKAHDVALAIPKPGETVDVDSPPPLTNWWQSVS